MQKNLTEGSLVKNLIAFSLPYLLSCFLQTFYGLADLFIAGQFNGASTISAVSIGSQVMHMLTVIIAGLAMGTTISISQSVGAGNHKRVAKSIGNTVIIFCVFALIATVGLLLAVDGVIGILSTPPEAVHETRQYLMVCFAGIPFITAYNVISSIFRGLGDSKSPMYFVAVAGILNIVLDYILIGYFDMGAAGAAIATVFSQAVSVVIALIALRRFDLGVAFGRKDLRVHKPVFEMILKIGIPIAVQDGFIQISFLIITTIANGRGVTAAASVGIVEKIISFLFLVNSAMLSSVSAIAAQNIGAGKRGQAKKVLYYGIMISVSFGILAAIVCELFTPQIISLFVKNDPAVVVMGAQYLRSYIFDCMFAAIHFCFSGYFCACGKAIYSFIHNTAAILLVRIPGTYLASVFFPESLFPMGVAAPAGSFLSAIICVVMFYYMEKKINIWIGDGSR
ncbi:MAG TPA: MATE family efflux transporter [Candidatus Fimousia stercorigallinarum]|nr:MATE family efflux transporter [Candidatus Fimousia stercorigallinarum]